MNRIYSLIFFSIVSCDKPCKKFLILMVICPTKNLKKKKMLSFLLLCFFTFEAPINITEFFLGKWNISQTTLNDFDKESQKPTEFMELSFAISTEDEEPENTVIVGDLMKENEDGINEPFLTIKLEINQQEQTIGVLTSPPDEFLFNSLVNFDNIRVDDQTFCFSGKDNEKNIEYSFTYFSPYEAHLTIFDKAENIVSNYWLQKPRPPQSSSSMNMMMMMMPLISMCLMQMPAMQQQQQQQA